MKHIRILIAAFLLVSVTACTARYIRQAQDEFSRGARLENAALVRGYDVDFNHLAEDPGPAYRISLSLVNRELDENEGELRRDKLYGTALMLKAMCLWRLASDRSGQRAGVEGTKVLVLAQSAEDPIRTEETGAKVKNESAASRDELNAVIHKVRTEVGAGRIVLGQRDHAMLNALPGLMDHDMGLQAKTYEEAERFFRSALAVLERTVRDKALVSPGSQMAIYLRLAMLSTCRAWHYAAFAFHADDNSSAKRKAKPSEEKAKEIIGELEPLAKGDNRLDNAIKRMKARMGIL